MSTTLILASALGLLGPAVLAWFGRRRAQQRLGPGEMLLSHMALWALTLLSAALAWGSGTLSAAALGWARPDAWTLAIGLGLAAYFVLMHGPLAAKALVKAGNPGFGEGLDRLSGLSKPVLVMAVVSGAIVEEMLYRSVAIAALEQLSGSVGVAVVLSTLAFALAHVPLWGWLASVTIGAAGLVFALVFVWTRDLGVTILAHVLTDLAGIVLAQRAARRAA